MLFLLQKEVGESVYSPNNIRYYRTLAGLTQYELADKLGIKQPTMSQYERGTRNPSIIDLRTMAKIFKVSVDDLIGTKSTSIATVEALMTESQAKAN